MFSILLNVKFYVTEMETFMNSNEIMNELFALAENRDYSKSCDTCKSGNPNVAVDKVAIAMVATPNIIKLVKEWGAQLLIVHEPTYYNHSDIHSDEKIECEKRKLIEDSGLTIYRYHDHPHYTLPDIIAVGELKQLGLKGTIENTEIFDLVRLHLDEPITPLELAGVIEERLNIKHVRICGARNTPCKVISGMFGAPGHEFDELKRDESEIVLTGETCEWICAEYARDAAQLGYKKALLIMGHVGSERDGMMYTADLLKEKHPELDIKYFDCDEVYTYTDSE